jgi:hypothetical protein
MNQREVTVSTDEAPPDPSVSASSWLLKIGFAPGIPVMAVYPDWGIPALLEKLQQSSLFHPNPVRFDWEQRREGLGDISWELLVVPEAIGLVYEDYAPNPDDGPLSIEPRPCWYLRGHLLQGYDPRSPLNVIHAVTNGAPDDDGNAESWFVQLVPDERQVHPGAPVQRLEPTAAPVLAGP